MSSRSASSRWTPTTASRRPRIGGQIVFACLVALVAGAPPALEATIAFGLALAFGLELQGRRVHRP